MLALVYTMVTAIPHVLIQLILTMVSAYLARMDV